MIGYIVTRKKSVKQMMLTVKILKMKALITTLKRLYFGWLTSLNTAEGMPNCPKVIHKDNVGIMSR